MVQVVVGGGIFFFLLFLDLVFITTMRGRSSVVIIPFFAEIAAS